MQTKEKAYIDPGATVGAVTLGVHDLGATTHFYHDVIGLDLLSEQPNSSMLGVDNQPLVILEHRPNGQAFPASPGLFHLAILVPSREDLGSWLKHFTMLGYRLDGVGDHIVSEALYLSDPEGNGIEIYRDRPREEWQYNNGQLIMDTLPVDIYSLIGNAYQAEFAGMPIGTKMGHIHLQVNDLIAASEFYRNVIGFDLMAELPSANFLSAGGYHHHIGMNVWRSHRASPRPEGSLGLVAFQVMLPDQNALFVQLSRMEELGANISRNRDYPQLVDPSGNVIQFVRR